MKTEQQATVFKALCASLQSPWGGDAVPAHCLAEATGLTLYATRKALRELKAEGLVRNACQGRPAVVSIGEIVELECEAMPPIRGFVVTALGRRTQEWAEAEREYNDGLRKWAMGEYDE